MLYDIMCHIHCPQQNALLLSYSSVWDPRLRSRIGLWEILLHTIWYQGLFFFWCRVYKYWCSIYGAVWCRDGVQSANCARTMVSYHVSYHVLYHNIFQYILCCAVLYIILYTKTSEVIFSAVIYRLFHEDLSSTTKTNTVGCNFWLYIIGAYYILHNIMLSWASLICADGH